MGRRGAPRGPATAAGIAGAFGTGLLLCGLLACGAPEGKGADPGGAGEPAAQDLDGDAGPGGSTLEGLFVERAVASGLEFGHFNGATGRFYIAEITGAGAALFDYDNDGDLDAYLVQGKVLEAGKSSADALFPLEHDRAVDRLFRNDLGDDGPRFVDVTDSSGLVADGYGMGVAVADVDRDGWLDLYLTNYGPNQLWRNLGLDPATGEHAGFEDITASAGLDEERWSAAATFVDVDGDGWLDLFVGNYLAAPVDQPKVCRGITGAQDYCGPASYPPLPDRLWRNLGADGRLAFEDVTLRSGIRGGFGPTLGVLAADVNGDDRPDLYVANDQASNQMWVQQEDGTFRDEALLAGSAVNAQGRAEASMGVDAADFDGDGDDDLFMTHLTGETNTLYRNDGQGMFDDVSVDTGLAIPSRAFTSFGTRWLDADNDGWLDLFVANGAVKTIEQLAREQDPFPFHQPNQLFRNLGGDAGFEDVTAEVGGVLTVSEVSRGVAGGDVDNDGDVDLLIANNNGPARLLINTEGQNRPWLGLRLVDAGGIDVPGARAALLRTGQEPTWRRVRVDGSFASASDPRLLFGLGDGAAPLEGVLVRWPDGGRERWPASAVAAGAYTVLTRGEGEPQGAAP
ncbi:MAG: CRTAC1 family protein [Acidobacteriota bacterium]